MKIKKLELMTFSSEFGRKNSFGSPKSLKIISIIRIKTDKEIEGFGEIYLGIYISPKIIKEILKLIEKLILNKNPIELIDNQYFPHIPFVGGISLCDGSDVSRPSRFGEESGWGQLCHFPLLTGG